MSKCNATKFSGKGRKNFKPKESRSKSITNDFKWWNKYPALTSDAAEFPFNRIAGEPIGLEGSGNQAFPGVYIYEYIPTIGRSINADSPFMAQVRSLWLDMHRKYRGIGQYQVSDLGVWIFCTINAFAEIARAEKIYGYYTATNVYNRNQPRMLIEGNRVQWDPSLRHLADFRASLDVLITLASKICLPKGFSAYEDAIVLASATIKDSTSNRASLATFLPEGFYTFNPTKYSTGSAAEYHWRTVSGEDGLQTFDDIITDLQAMLNPLFNDNDCQRIASDILAAYSENGVETRSAVPVDYVSPIGKDDVRLKQIHNATLLGGTVITRDGNVDLRLSNIKPGAAVGGTTPVWSPVSCLDITQVDDVLYSDLYVVPEMNQQLEPAYAANTDIELPADCQIPKLESSQEGFFVPQTPSADPKLFPIKVNDRLIDTWEDDVSTEEKMEITRFTVPVKLYVANSSSKVTYPIFAKLLAHGTNVLTRLRVITRNTGTGASITSDALAQAPAMSYFANYYNDYVKVLYFDWAPLIYPQIIDTTMLHADRSATVDAVSVLGDVDHFTRVDDNSNTLQMLHYAAMLSAYKCELTSTSKLENF